ncbi:fungal-specific transcription factor domain-containing protein [Colletotrichum navitas]|uniref:Fungal-specific transcription factor domain-containing protein n=1 Tax=Colletotrichum navitas TaxID=681940 RepID=A0AAD8PQH5_9PEZI|nr:fungal-specific transcription factor domain-containing protein [Colletotrichum navitas]KAK1574447.1 fungal-specific transcription factor domain-containing protein [Colletotrichum navitas]
MDASAVFRHGLGNMMPRNLPYHHHLSPNPPPQLYPGGGRPPTAGREDPESDATSNRIAHTLTACCRCRQRKTRCDPTLPRCLPCERAGSVCEYFDTTKGKKINRNYVIKLQEKVRALEAELRQYTDDDSDFAHVDEDIVRPGGMVRLNDTDETPRYLGPSSGIAMTRLLVQGAKFFTDSKRISELIPEVRARRMTRMQSIVMTRDRKKSYPLISAHPAQALPNRPVADKLVDVFCQRSQVFWPTLHEKQFLEDLEAVYAGDQDPYKNLIVRMVFAISLQKLDPQYAGLADSYYLAAMEHFEQVVRPKDLKSLQSLAMIGQYSLLTPTRTAVYYMVGLATRVCQAEGLTDEKTISAGYSIDPLTLDMRRRLAYIITSMEAGLAHSMGRPNGFSKVDDRMDVEPFATVDDEYITADGIGQGPPSEKKLVALHFFKMRMEQAEIRRVLYEKKRDEPRDENHPWFAKMERDIQNWIDSSPQNPAWCRPWFTGRYHQMRIFLYRPSPQVPRPSPRAAGICFEGAAYIINLSKQQMEKAAVDITWVFLLNLYMSLNTLLWTVSYPEIRQAHPREEVEELGDQTLDILEQCTERWPGTAQAVQLYSIFVKACLQSYEARDTPQMQTSSTFTTPPSLFDGNSPQGSEGSASTAPGGGPSFKVNQPHNPPQFNFVFDATPESMNTYQWDPNFPPHPTFRSNSIWGSSNENTGRRLSSTYPPESPLEDSTPPATTTPAYTSSSSPPSTINNAMPTPPDSMGGHVGTPSSSTISPPPMGTPAMSHSSPLGLQHGTPNMAQHSTNMSPPPPPVPGMGARAQNFAHLPTSNPAGPQRPLPHYNSGTDWFNPPPPFINPDTFSSMGNSYFGDPLPANGLHPHSTGMGLDHFGGQSFSWSQERQGSLSQQQQIELMNALENEGMSDIDALLMGMNGVPNAGGSNWAHA